MPLPADGAVSGYEFAIGDRVIKGVIDRKRAARERFEHAIASGRTAALLEQERADIFTQQIGNIPRERDDPRADHDRSAPGVAPRGRVGAALPDGDRPALHRQRRHRGRRCARRTSR